MGVNNSRLDQNILNTLSNNSQNEKYLIVMSDFTSSTNNINLKKGQLVKFHNMENNKQWFQVHDMLSDQLCWIPSNLLMEYKNNNLDNSDKYCHLFNFNWFHGKITRQDGEHLLRSGINGSYLVRESESQPGQLSITLRYEGRVYHYRISCNSTNGNYFITENYQFPTVVELINYHSKQPEGLISPLLYAVSNKSAKAIVVSSHFPEDSSWEIDRSEILMHQKLGGGQYGEVYEAVWKRYNIIVAVKTLKDDTNLKYDDFLKEAVIMRKLRHKNLVQLFGICTKEPPFYLITEFLSKGNLLDFLRNCNRFEVLPYILIYMATQISAGMCYLETNNFIHRDLAARNCLVGDCFLIKIADFGLARNIAKDDIYIAKVGAKFPIKWTSPESLAFNKFSSKSDVWSFGVILWELATYGMSPYPGIELQNVYHLLNKGYRMDCPEGCPKIVYELMLKCWDWEPKNRPTFSQLLSNLEIIYFGSREKAGYFSPQIENHKNAAFKPNLNFGDGSSSQSLNPEKCLDLDNRNILYKSERNDSLLDESGVGESLPSVDSVSGSLNQRIKPLQSTCVINEANLENFINATKNNKSNDQFSTIPTSDRINLYLESMKNQSGFGLPAEISQFNKNTFRLELVLNELDNLITNNCLLWDINIKLHECINILQSQHILLSSKLKNACIILTELSIQLSSQLDYTEKEKNDIITKIKDSIVTIRNIIYK